MIYNSFAKKNYSIKKSQKKFLIHCCSTALALGAITGAVVNVQAGTNDKQRPSYDYIGLSYMTQNLDSPDCSQDGPILDASVTLSGGFYVKGDYTDMSGDICGSSTLKAGLGYRHPWGDYWHMYAVASFADRSYDGGGGDSGPVGAVGIRGYFQPGLEGYAQLEHSTLEDGDLTASVGGAYHLGRGFALTAGVALNPDQSALMVGGRFHF